MKKLIVPLLAAVIAAGCVTSKKSASIPIIDTHIHLYDTTRPEGVPWPPETDKVLYKPILTKDFDSVSDENGVNATVIVEASNRRGYSNKGTRFRALRALSRMWHSCQALHEAVHKRRSDVGD